MLVWFFFFREKNKLPPLHTWRWTRERDLTDSTPIPIWPPLFLPLLLTTSLELFILKVTTATTDSTIVEIDGKFSNDQIFQNFQEKKRKWRNGQSAGLRPRSECVCDSSCANFPYLHSSGLNSITAVLLQGWL